MNKLKALVMTLLFPVLAYSQVEIVPSAGYMFGGGVKFYEGKLKIADGMNYGVSIIVPDVKYATDLEISYTRLDSKASFTAYKIGYQDQEVDVSTNYFQIGAMKTLGGDDKIKPFGSFSLGATVFSPKVSNYDDTWRFSVTLGLGAKFMFSQRVGIILRGRLMLPMNFGGVGGYYGIGTGGSGGGLYVDSYAAIVQGDFSGGLVISLGK